MHPDPAAVLPRVPEGRQRRTRCRVEEPRGELKRIVAEGGIERLSDESDVGGGRMVAGRDVEIARHRLSCALRGEHDDRIRWLQTNQLHARDWAIDVYVDVGHVLTEAAALR